MNGPTDAVVSIFDKRLNSRRATPALDGISNPGVNELKFILSVFERTGDVSTRLMFEAFRN
jgi:hypothetical protein